MNGVAPLERNSLAAAVLVLHGHRDEAGLYFHLGTLERWCRRYTESPHRAQRRMLFAVKICPNRPALDIIDRHVDGYDVTNLAEFRHIERYDLSGRVVSVCGPAVARADLEAILGEAHRIGRVIVVFDSLSQFEQGHGLVAATPGARYMFRISESELNPRFESKFGVRFSDVVVAEGFLGLHVHMSREADLRRVEVFESFVRRCREVPGVEWINLGGGQHFYDWFELDRRLGGDPTLTIAIEPGQPLFLGAGFGVGRVWAVKPLPGRTEVLTNLSQLCHTEWSRNKVLLYPGPMGGGPPLRVRVQGPTCCAADILTDVSLPAPAGAPLVYAPGDVLIFGEITPASAQLNRSFNGVPAAFVRFF